MADDTRGSATGPAPSAPAVAASFAATHPSSSHEDSTTGEGSPEDERTADKSDRSSSSGDRSDRSISDFVRRAVSAGVFAASRSKDDIMRAAGGEVRGWLEHLNLHEEITKVLSKMVVEVKTEIRFRPSDDGRIVPETTNDVKIKGPPR